jgi:hypothetical protein
MDVNGQVHSTAALGTEKDLPVSFEIVRWIDPRTVLDALDRGMISFRCWK